MLNFEKYAEFIKVNTPPVKELLDSKGFLYSREEDTQMMALINSEIGELTNAIKKNLGNEEEGAEVADIAIRLLNVVCMLPEIIDNLDDGLDIDVDIIDFIKERLGDVSVIRQKYFFCNHLTFNLSDLFQLVMTDELDCDNYINAGYCIISSIFALDRYCEVFLGTTLQEEFDKKMNFNQTRPYRYNISEEHFEK